MADVSKARKIQLTQRQARRFILRKQGLLGDYRFVGEQGVCDYIRQAGCVQFDPIDVCGKNAELVLQSRVKGFTKEMLHKLLYEDRKLVDYFDKNMSIFCVEDWPCFAFQREYYRAHGRNREMIDRIADEIEKIVGEKGFAAAKDLPYRDQVDWYWSPTNLARAALETLYFRGDLVIHHKKGTVKHYSLAKDFIPPDLFTADSPFRNEQERITWQIKRRVGSVGLLWNKPSDAWLGIDNLKAAQREMAFQSLMEQGLIMALCVENIPQTLYCLAEDASILRETLEKSYESTRTELIAPLDNMMWDRRLVQALFGFSYKWEIYTSVVQRVYGYYVLPILSGERFAGRAEIVADQKANELSVLHFWWEEEPVDREQLEECIERFAAFNGCDGIRWAR